MTLPPERRDWTSETACHLLRDFAAVGEAPVVVDFAVRAPETALDFRAALGVGAEAITTAYRNGSVVGGIVIRFLGEAAGEFGAAAAACVESVDRLGAALHAEPGAITATLQRRGTLQRPVAAAADTEPGRQWPAAAAREKLEHAADGLGTIEAGAWPAHELDPLDLLQRQVLQGSGAGGGRPDLDAVDQHQQVVGVRAAHEEGRESCPARRCW